MKSIIVVVAVLCSLVACADAFTSVPPPSSSGSVGRAMPRLSTALANMLQEYANYNDVWDGDYGYGIFVISLTAIATIVLLTIFILPWPN